MAKRRITRQQPKNIWPRRDTWRQLSMAQLSIRIQADKIDSLRQHIFRRGIGEPPGALEARLEAGRDALEAAVNALRSVAAGLEAQSEAQAKAVA